MTSGISKGGENSTGVKYIFGKLNDNFKGHKAASEGAAKDSARASSIMSGLAATSTGNEPPQVIANHPEAETVMKLGWDPEESLGKSRYQRIGTVIPSDVTKIDSAESVHRLVLGGMSLFRDITSKRVGLAEWQDDGQIEQDDYAVPTYGGVAVMSETPEGEELQYPTVKIDPAHPRYQTMNNEVHNYVEVIDDEHLRIRVTRNAAPEKWDNQPVADIVISNDRDTVEKMLWQLSESIEGGWIRNENHIVADKPGEVYHVREARPFVRTWMENARNMAEELEEKVKPPSHRMMKRCGTTQPPHLTTKKKSKRQDITSQEANEVTATLWVTDHCQDRKAHKHTLFIAALFSISKHFVKQ